MFKKTKQENQKKTTPHIIRLRTKLIVIFASLVVAIALLIVVSVYQVGSRIIRENTATAYLSGLDYLVQVLDESLTGTEYATYPMLMDTATKNKLRDYGVYSPFERYQANQYFLSQLKNITVQNSYIDSAYLYFADDKILIGTNLSHTYTGAELDRAGWSALLTSEDYRRLGQWVLTTSLSEPQQPMVSNFKWLLGQNNKVLGVLVVNMKTQFWSDVPGRTGADSIFTVLSADSNGTVLAAAGQDEDFSRSYDAGRLSALKGEGYFTDGEYTVAYTRSEYNGWYYLGVARTAEILKGLQSFRNTVVLALAGILAVTVLAVGLVTAHIMHPVNVLKSSMEQVGLGDLSVCIRETRNDDFQILYNGFNSMVTNLDLTVKTVYRQKLEQKDMSMQVMRSQINAHFLYNTLDTIHWIAVLHDDNEVSELVMHLANYYRMMLNQGRDLLTIADTLSLLESYLKIWEAKNDVPLEFKTDIPDNIRGVYVLKNIIQPLLENSLQHGLDEERSGPLTILLKCRGNTVNSTLTVTLEDNGKGIEPGRLAAVREALQRGDAAPGEGFALKNINNQIRTYYGEEYGLQIESEENRYTRVKMTLPMR